MGSLAQTREPLSIGISSLRSGNLYSEGDTVTIIATSHFEVSPTEAVTFFLFEGDEEIGEVSSSEWHETPWDTRLSHTFVWRDVPPGLHRIHVRSTRGQDAVASQELAFFVGDDPGELPVVSYRVVKGNVTAEGGESIVIEIVREGNLSKALEVETVGIRGTARFGSDYHLVADRSMFVGDERDHVRFEPHQQALRFEFRPLRDREPEGDETISMYIDADACFQNDDLCYLIANEPIRATIRDVPPPSVTITKTLHHAVWSIEFEGTLQSSIDLKTWKDVVPQPTSPFEYSATSANRFFRSRNED